MVSGVPEPVPSKPSSVQSTSTAAAKGLPRPHAQQSPMELAEAPEDLPGQLHGIPAVSMQPLQHVNARQTLPERAAAPQWPSGQLPSISASDIQPLHQPNVPQSRLEAELPAGLPGGLISNGRAQRQTPCLTEAAPHACISAPASSRGQTRAVEHLHEDNVGAVPQGQDRAETEALQSSRHGDAAAVSRDSSVQDCEADPHAALAAPSTGKAWCLLKPMKAEAVCFTLSCTHHQ